MKARQILVFGPPGSGKTAITSRVAARLGWTAVTMDDKVESVKSDRSLADLDLTDADITELARALIMGAVESPQNALVELAHHDYVELIAAIPSVTTFSVVVTTASLGTLEARNGRRDLDAQVPFEYVRRCHAAVERVPELFPRTIARFDTDICEEEQLVERLIELLVAAR